MQQASTNAAPHLHTDPPAAAPPGEGTCALYCIRIVIQPSCAGVQASPSEDDEQETCGFCRFMKGGGCRQAFIVRMHRQRVVHHTLHTGLERLCGQGKGARGGLYRRVQGQGTLFGDSFPINHHRVNDAHKCTVVSHNNQHRRWRCGSACYSTRTTMRRCLRRRRTLLQSSRKRQTQPRPPPRSRPQQPTRPRLGLDYSTSIRLQFIHN